MRDLTALREKLSQEMSGDLPGDVTRAAVLIPFVAESGGWSVVFTRRAEELSTHSGEISFPGGRVDAGESSRDAALREAEEELGIDPAKVEVLGRLNGVFTFVSNYMIEPWVGIVPGDRFRPSPKEIAEVISVPLATLTDPATRREQRFIRAGVIASNPAYDVGSNIIWGATARILTDLLELLD